MPDPSFPDTGFSDTGAVESALAARVLADELDRDSAQFELARALDRVLADMDRARLASKSSALGWLFGSTKPAEAARGLYVHGGVGLGKSMLMDMFFDLAPVERKRRVHFHAFMDDVHARIHAHRQRRSSDADPIPPVAEHWAAEARLLCFDEFAVTDVADAMILSRLFTALFERGVTVVATSNVSPRDLYKDGLNRGSFLKFVDLVETRMAVHHLRARTDYRRQKLRGSPVWFTHDPAGFERLWTTMTDGAAEERAVLDRRNRDLAVERTVGGFTRATFQDLCARPLGAADYLALANRFHTLFLEAVPVLDHARRNEAKRFIALVDALYEARRRLVVAAAAEPDALYPVAHGTEAFEFDRTVSRLVEMRGQDWLDAVS